MLFTLDLTPLDEAAAGYPVDIVPDDICRMLLRSITTPPIARRAAITKGGKAYVATWAGNDRIRIASHLSTEIVAETIGPGAELKAIFQTFGIREIPGCACGKIARWMNEIGPQGCRDNLDRIVDAIEAEAKKRPALRAVPFKRRAITALVRLAIQRAHPSTKTP